jgi:hypothetical protein
MKIILAVLILMLNGLSLCCQPKDNNELSEQEYAVYPAIIGERPKNFIVIDETLADVFGEFSSGGLPELLPGVLSETIDNYSLRNRKPIILPENSVQRWLQGN